MALSRWGRRPGQGRSPQLCPARTGILFKAAEQGSSGGPLTTAWMGHRPRASNQTTATVGGKEGVLSHRRTTGSAQTGSSHPQTAGWWQSREPPAQPHTSWATPKPHRHLCRYKCECDPGWSGANCGVNNNECESNPCVNGGSCRDMTGGYVCACREGFSGERALQGCGTELGPTATGTDCWGCWLGSTQGAPPQPLG